jgi:hypothetical protein
MYIKEAECLAKAMPRICDYCQAYEHPHQPLSLKIVSTPIMPYIISSVCNDLFIMPETEYDGKLYNVFAACVNRHSGWIVATAHHTKGLTAANVAKAMYRNWWSPHGIPSVITSDRGPQFVGAWWRTMCAEHGIRHAYSQAHHHPVSGRDEKAGIQIQQQLRKEWSENEKIRVEVLPIALNQIRDAEGPAGLSPDQILYGRDRPYAGIPYDPPTRAEDATSFFQRQRAIDKQVADSLNAEHEKKRSPSQHKPKRTT